MTTTTNYGYTVVVGSDTPVNIQNDIAPNFTAIDTDLKAVSDSSITVATHTVAGTVHNLVRTDADRNVMYFVATGDMAAGDTFTVDGVTVTARLVNGESLATGSFKINNNVLGILVGTVLNLYVPGASATASNTSYDNTGSGLTATNVQDAIDEVVSDIPTGFAASAITYNNTLSGLTATDVQYAIDELAAGISSGSVSVTADGVKTQAQVLASLFALVDATKINEKSVLVVSNLVMHMQIKNSGEYKFACTRIENNNQVVTFSYTVSATGGTYRAITGASTTTFNDFSSAISTFGDVYKIVY